MATIRSAYEPRERLSIAFVDENGEPLASRTKQSFKEECDIDNVVKKFQRTGVIEHIRRHGGEYGNAPDVTFKEAMDIVARGKSMWEDLPSSLKQKFNGPEHFVAFATDPANLDEMRELGLAKPAPGESEPAEPASPAEPVVEPGTGGTES